MMRATESTTARRKIAPRMVPGIVPIPGTTKLHRLDENLGALRLDLSVDDLRDIEAAAARVAVVGERYPESLARMTGR